MTNAIRHGKCASLEVELQVANGEATLTIADDGTGFEPTEIAHGSGLTGMNERMRRLRGTVRIESAEGRGTKVIAVVPIDRKQPEEAV
jgi:signal transduction histidine kinase